jgi:hypothetical protein
VGTFVARATANAEGEVQMDVPPGDYDVVVLGADGDPAAGLAILDDDRHVPLEAPLTIQLPPRARYEGTITDPLLDAVPAATLALVRVGGENGLPEPALEGTFVGFAEIAGDDGSFSVDVPPGTYRVTVRPALSSPAPMVSRVVTIPAEGLVQDIDLPDHAVVAGTVKFLGVPAAGSYVRVFGDAADERGAAIQLGEGQCGPDGNFEIVVGTSP